MNWIEIRYIIEHYDERKTFVLKYGFEESRLCGIWRRPKEDKSLVLLYVGYICQRLCFQSANCMLQFQELLQEKC